ncbi:MAG: hypothetical protein PHD81_00565 [Candidatus Nanoarchaeia archaeon]|nr:hypothetical protein [Candidatus Nanoarchaeia archaeon]MDD5587582.1 hypothetical protein [Candidatus Nanoarchaeia archaeon]
MNKKNLNIFKIEYDWHEGEHEETLLTKEIEREGFEKDLVEAKKFAESLISKKEIKTGEKRLGKGYYMGCTPEYYEQIIWFLINKKGYIECYFDKGVTYFIGDETNKKIEVIKSEKEIKQIEL